MREMTQDDLPQVLAIEEASFSAPFSEAMFRKELSLPIAHLLVAFFVPSPLGGEVRHTGGEAEGEGGRSDIVGYVDWWLVYDEIHIINIAVREMERRRGIATRLLRNALESGKSAGARFAWLEVRQTNRAAQELYRRFGFESFGVRKGYYHDTGENAVLMGKNL